MKIIDGKQISVEIKKEIVEKINSDLNKGIREPHLAAIIVGEDGASKTYIDSIRRVCTEVGFLVSIYQHSPTVTEEELLSCIDFLNRDDEVDGYIIQMPLPKHISMEHVIAHVDPKKDVDCFHPINYGKLLLGEAAFLPATPYGTMELLKRSGIQVAGKHCVVLGRSNIVGKPLAMLLAEKSEQGNATVTICHSHTANLKEICASADVLLVAIGKPEMITAEYVKKGAVVIDIGIHRIPDSTTEKGYRICGDVKYDEVAPQCSAITPVPGGVGPMTMVCLLLNTMKAAQLNRKE
ncbi:MAG: bifunctional 5,10-methylene-tetrahydrofolate dehydrogenase/5,10-methylene-tetrahydrofolate cyclohydrolase [Bacteroidales bacterium]|jgi:methylenetetrahydrofolate dehydrogenase (NADP+) / methenyltetrahydrofolate cyclohydrolase|nr:bifunctional 5,10-methylene-tetrahydrofolate dehydrogenase/5,10-methylene-tetrahydrofolate cyclohydrolase [Bacteroidales bacterium]